MELVAYVLVFLLGVIIGNEKIRNGIINYVIKPNKKQPQQKKRRIEYIEDEPEYEPQQEEVEYEEVIVRRPVQKKAVEKPAAKGPRKIIYEDRGEKL